MKTSIRRASAVALFFAIAAGGSAATIATTSAPAAAAENATVSPEAPVDLKNQRLATKFVLRNQTNKPIWVYNIRAREDIGVLEPGEIVTRYGLNRLEQQDVVLSIYAYNKETGEKGARLAEVGAGALEAGERFLYIDAGYGQHAITCLGEHQTANDWGTSRCRAWIHRDADTDVTTMKMSFHTLPH